MRHSQRSALSRIVLRAAHSAPAQIASDLERLGRNMKSILIIVFCLLLQGCIPLQQYEITGTRQFEHLSVDDGYFMESLSPSNQPKQKKIIADESYIVGPRGDRYLIELQSHDYDVRQQHPYIRDRIYPLDSKGNRLRSIRNGDWTLHLVLESESGKEMRQFKAKLWSFFYSPVAHGAPN